MSLSPFIQYYIRKLLSKQLDSLGNLVAEEAGLDIYFQMDLNQILGTLYPRVSEMVLKERMIETLVLIHRTCQPADNYHFENLQEVENRIFSLLGLELLSMSHSALVPIVDEQIERLFRFYKDGCLYQGINYGGELYGLVQAYRPSQKPQAYQLALALLEQQVPAILTLSSNRCGLWVSLRSPTYDVLRHQEAVLSEKVPHLHSILCKFRRAMVEEDWRSPRPLDAEFPVSVQG